MQPQSIMPPPSQQMIINKYPYFIGPSTLGHQSIDQHQFAAAFNMQHGQSPQYFHLHPSSAIMSGALYPIQPQQQQMRYQHPPPLIQQQQQQQELKLNSDLNSVTSSTESTSPASSSQSPGLAVQQNKNIHGGSDEDKLNKSAENNKKRQNYNKQNYDRQSNLIRTQTAASYQQQQQFIQHQQQFFDSNRNLYSNNNPSIPPPPGLTQQMSINENSGTCTPPPSSLLLSQDLNVITNQKLLNSMKNQQMSPIMNNSTKIYNKNETSNKSSKQQPLQQRSSSSNNKTTDPESNSASPSPSSNYNENGKPQQQQITFINSALPLTTLFNPTTGQQFIQPNFIDNDVSFYIQPPPPQTTTNNENNRTSSNSSGNNNIPISSTPGIAIPSNFVTYQPNQSQLFNLIPLMSQNIPALNPNNNNSNINPNNGPQLNIIQAYPPPPHYMPNGSFKYPQQHVFSAPGDLQFMNNNQLIDNSSFTNDNISVINNNYIKNAHSTFQKKKSCYNCGNNHLATECREASYESLHSTPSKSFFKKTHHSN